MLALKLGSYLPPIWRSKLIIVFFQSESPNEESVFTVMNDMDMSLGMLTNKYAGIYPR